MAPRGDASISLPSERKVRALNFNFQVGPTRPRVPPAVPVLGAAAEFAFEKEPDLALWRCRQLLEVLVGRLERDGAIVVGRSLEDRMAAVERCYGSGFDFPSLHRLRREANEAVHHASGVPRERGMFASGARRGLLTLSRAWAAYTNTAPLPTSLALPTDRRSVAQAVLDMLLHLDELEDAVDRRDDATVRVLLPAVSDERIKGSGMPLAQVDVARFRRDSAVLSHANHSGRIGDPTISEDRVRHVLSIGRWGATEAALHHIARAGVSRLNALSVEEAVDGLVPWVEYATAKTEFAPMGGGSAGVRDWQLGALLGTLGQALCIWGHRDKNESLVREGMRKFEIAERHFLERDDRMRQETYRLHALVEVLRVGGELSEQEKSEVSREVRDAPFVGLHDGAPLAVLYRCAWAAKASWYLGLQPDWLPSAKSVLRSLPLATLRRHPAVNLVGWMSLLLGPPRRPEPACEVLAEVVAAGEPLLSWIAGSFLAETQQCAAPPPPHVIAAWWVAAAKKWSSARPVDRLPFYLG